MKQIGSLMFAALVAFPLFAAESSPLFGASKQQVFNAYGAPTSQLKSGRKEIFVYSRGRVLFENGVVAQITLPLPVPPKPSPAPAGIKSQLFTPPPAQLISSPASAPLPPLPAFGPVSPAPSNPMPLVIDQIRWFAVCGVGLVGAAFSARFVVRSLRRHRSLQEQLIGLDPLATESAGFEQHIGARLDVFRRRENFESYGPKPSVRSDRPSLLNRELLMQLEWRRFELLVTGYFNAIGTKATRSSVGADGGIDIFLHPDPVSPPAAVVQCKAWIDPVGVSPVRELFGVMAASGFREGYFVTTSSFSDAALSFAKTTRLHLWTGQDLVDKLNTLPAASLRALLAEITTGDYTTPTCPSCDIKMSPRQGNKPFWGCRNFPRCRSIINIRR